jgi:hypothetical protein
MKRFAITGSFPAEDIEDAFARLSYHFEDLRDPTADSGHPHFLGHYWIAVEPEAESATGRAEPS